MEALISVVCIRTSVYLVDKANDVLTVAYLH